MKRTKETLEARVRETPLRERLEQSQQRIGAMCSERRGPRMCIPVEHTDDDFFISTTLQDAVNTFDQAREALKLARRRLNEGMHGKIDAVMEHDGDPGIVKLLDEALAAMEATHE